ncbi:MAG: hypothetical protein VX112_04170 [Pseudomonadota bacterium]|nr:hypothetical protein [Pseudomonadota bacterium]
MTFKFIKAIDKVTITDAHILASDKFEQLFMIDRVKIGLIDKAQKNQLTVFPLILMVDGQVRKTWLQ